MKLIPGAILLVAALALGIYVVVEKIRYRRALKKLEEEFPDEQ